MKQVLFTLMLYIVALSPLAAVCQWLPDGPAPAGQTGSGASGQAGDTPAAQPAGMPDSQWRRVADLARGERIVVTSTYGPPLECRFAGATDAYLLCDEPNGPAGTGYCFDRDKVLRVDEEQPQAAAPTEHNWHPGVLVAVATTGTVMGLLGANGADARTGFMYGLGSAAIVGAVGLGVSALTDHLFAPGLAGRMHRTRRMPHRPVHPRPRLPVER